MTRKQELALIWKHTHRDYRGVLDGQRSILVLREGGTHAVPLDQLTDAERTDRLASAMRREANVNTFA